MTEEKRIVATILTDELSFDSETIDMEGVDFGPFLHHGYITQNGTYVKKDIIGAPDSKTLKLIEFTDEKGKPHKGWQVECKLVNLGDNKAILAEIEKNSQKYKIERQSPPSKGGGLNREV